MPKFSEKFFCPAPWMNIYYQTNSPSPCHIIRNTQLNMTPQEYINSDWLAQIKQNLVDGKVPPECGNCKRKEDLGLKSTRGAFWGYCNSGEEPEFNDQWFAGMFDADTPTVPRRLEFRFSNLCNMKCRMCDETSSSEWALEKNKFNLPPQRLMNPDGLIDTTTNHIIKITEDKVAGLKDLNLVRKLKKVGFTGGEPFLIKEYYDYLDFLIEHKLNKNIQLEMFTNCSVYNPKMIERLMQFESVNLIMSLDGVGKVAEYIRHGTPWSTVEKNALLINSLPRPILPEINVAISAYTLLDVANLAKFLMKLYDMNNIIAIKCYSVLFAELRFQNVPIHLKSKMLDQIDQAIEVLTAPNYEVFKNELKNIKSQLISNGIVINAPQENIDLFYEFTETLDKIRGENFQDVFDIALRS